MKFYKLTFDIGTRNLAYSLGCFDSSDKSFQIVFGKTIDLDNYGKMLDVYNNDPEHTKSKMRSNKKYTQIEKIHIVNGVLIDIIHKKVIEKHEIKKIDKVLIEKQCSFTKKLVYSVSYIVYSFFTQLKHNGAVHNNQIEIGSVKMVSGSIKMVENSWNRMDEPTQSYLEFVRELFDITPEQIDKQSQLKRRPYIFKIYFDAIIPTKEEFEETNIENRKDIKGLYDPVVVIKKKVKDENSNQIKKTKKMKNRYSKTCNKKIADWNHTKNKFLSIRLCLICLYHLVECGIMKEAEWKKIKSMMRKQMDKLDDYCDTLNYVFETDLESTLGTRNVMIIE